MKSPKDKLLLSIIIVQVGVTVTITYSQQNGDSRRVQQIPQRRMGISLEQMHGQRACSPG